MAQSSFRDIFTVIKTGKELAPVYLLMGEESFYIDKLVEAFEHYVIPEDDRDFNQHIFYGNDSDIETIAACAQQYPVMADRKLVILKEAQTMYNAKNQLEHLTSYVQHPSKSTVLVVAFKGDNLNASSKLVKAASATGGVVFKSAQVKDYQLPSHVKDYCSERKVNIDDRAVDMLCEYIGSPLSKLFGELAKLIQINGGNKITAADIQQHIGISKNYNNFELAKAVSMKNYQQCVRIIRYFALNPRQNPTVMTTATLFNLFSRIAIGHYTADKSDKSLMEAMGLKNSYPLREIKDGMRNYNPFQAVTAMHALREFDSKSKGVGSYQNEYDLLQEMIFKIFTA